MRYLATVLITVILAGQGATYADETRFAGSGFARQFIEHLAEQYAKENNCKLTFAYSKGGTYAGLQELCEGKAEVAVIARPLEKPDTALLDQAFPEESKQPQRLLFAQAAIVVVVPKRSPVRKLTVEQVRRIFEQGQIDNWRQLGGSKAKIIRCAPKHPAPQPQFSR